MSTQVMPLKPKNDVPPVQFVVIGNPENRRIEYFQAALCGHGLLPARVVSYVDLLSNRRSFPDDLGPNSVVRIESPGENFHVYKKILLAGADAASEEGCPTIERDAIRHLEFDRGLILYPRQWYLGYRVLLGHLSDLLATIPNVRLLNQPDDIIAMFDKEICHARCHRAQLPVPRALGPVRSYDELTTRMNEAGMQRVFVKLANGSSASGVVAFSNIGGRPAAITSAEVVANDRQIRIYNSLKVRCYREPAMIVRLIDALCRERVHVEEWLPKASLSCGAFDLRIVTIDGEPRHTVVRQGRSFMTNLHLGNRRGDIDCLLDRLGADRWHEIQDTCRRSASLFPGTLHTGVDVCITPGWRRHAILEINAFGDLLPGILNDGLDTYSAEVASVLKRIGPSAVA
jgi:hypothetical protein